MESALQELERYEFEVGKCRIIRKSCDSEIKEYSKLYDEIQTKITGSEKDIAQLKKEWAAEKLERQHKEDFEALARQVNQFPERKGLIE
jgi:parvulin-like peptidyl-prolyl isomerase